jgi:hypothetical protein
MGYSAERIQDVVNVPQTQGSASAATRRAFGSAYARERSVERRTATTAFLGSRCVREVSAVARITAQV